MANFARRGIIPAEHIKARVTVPQLLEFYGVKITRNGRCACPIHNGKDPNMAVKEGYYKCFRCGSSGTVIDLQMALSGHSFNEAINDLDGMFRLGLGSNKPSDLVRSRFVLAERKERQRAEASTLEWNKKQYDLLCQVRRLRADSGRDCSRLDEALDRLYTYDSTKRIPAASIIAESVGCVDELVVIVFAESQQNNSG